MGPVRQRHRRVPDARRRRDHHPRTSSWRARGSSSSSSRSWSCSSCGSPSSTRREDTALVARRSEGGRRADPQAARGDGVRRPPRPRRRPGDAVRTHAAARRAARRALRDRRAARRASSRPTGASTGSRTWASSSSTAPTVGSHACRGRDRRARAEHAASRSVRAAARAHVQRRLAPHPARPDRRVDGARDLAAAARERHDRAVPLRRRAARRRDAGHSNGNGNAKHERQRQGATGTDVRDARPVGTADAQPADGATPIGRCPLAAAREGARPRSRRCGSSRSRGSPSLECTLADETGGVSLVFFGRRRDRRHRDRCVDDRRRHGDRPPRPARDREPGVRAAVISASMVRDSSTTTIVLAGQIRYPADRRPDRRAARRRTRSTSTRSSSSSRATCSSSRPSIRTAIRSARTRAAIPASCASSTSARRVPGLRRKRHVPVARQHPRARANVGMLFIDFEHPNRLRVNGVATRRPRPTRSSPTCRARSSSCGCETTQVFPNCSRYIHKR